MKVKVTYERVLEVYSKLKEKGEKITNQRVMDELGEGSFTTVHKYLKEIKERDEEKILLSLANLSPTEQIEKLSKELNVNLENFRSVTVKIIQNLQSRIKELTVENEELRTELKKYKE